MPRFFLEPDAWGENAALTGDEAMHCARVMRVKPGEEIEVFDGAGRSATAEAISVSRDQVELALGEAEFRPQPKVRLVLVQAVIKGKAMDWLIQKAVELGASAIQPLITEHCVVKLKEAKAGKWRRAALEACKQCGQPFLPEIAEPVTLASFLESKPEGLRLVASLSNPRRPLREVVEEQAEPPVIQYVVGPEGDFSPRELADLTAADFQPVDLGPQTLRSETAALFGLSALRYGIT